MNIVSMLQSLFLSLCLNRYFIDYRKSDLKKKKDSQNIFQITPNLLWPIVHCEAELKMCFVHWHQPFLAFLRTPCE